MEPISAVGLSVSLISCVKVITTSINSLLALQTKYRQADLTVQLFLGQLSTLRAALNEICQWINVSLIGVAQHEQLVLDLTTSIEGCKVLLLILSDRIALLGLGGVDQDGSDLLGLRGKMRLLWAEKESNQYFSLLNNQINALNLLLTALQCRTVHDQNILLQNDESRHIMHLVKDDTSSLLWLKDTDSNFGRQSIFSDSSSKLDVNFDFDPKILNSKPYQTAIRSTFARKKGGIAQRQRTPPNDTMSVVDHERSDDTEDDARIVRNKILDSHPLNDVNLNEIAKKSNHADDALLVTREKKGKMPQRKEPPPNHTTNMFGSEIFNDSKDDAQTIRGVFVDPRSLDDATEPINDKRSNHIENDAQSEIVAKSFDVEYSANSSIGPAASNKRGERSSEDNLLIDKRLPRLINPATQNPTLARIRRALFKLSVPALPLPTNEEGRNYVGTMDVNSNSQSLPSSVVRQHLQKKCKVLILGSSGAGKSTLWKSMTICHEGTLCGPNERERYIDIIHSNIIEDLLKILDAMDFEVPLGSTENEVHVGTIFGATRSRPHELSEGIALAVKALWGDSGVQKIFRMANSCQLNDSSGYFFDNITRIASSSYLPTNQDLLRLHIITTGIINKHFITKNIAYNIYDVGGRRAERRKWINCFEDTNIIIFLVDISAYDRCLYEDSTINMMQEALTLFDSICNSRWFWKTSMVLLFTKVHSLQRKLAISPIRDYFPDFEGDPLSFEAAKAYILTRFVSLSHRVENAIQVHFTDMTDDTSLGKAGFAALNKVMKLKEG